MSQVRPPELLAAIAAARPLSESWNQAVARLGAWRMALSAPPKQPARRTGRDQASQFQTLTSSHVFDHDRQALRDEFLHASGTRRAELIAWAQRQIPARKQAEKLASVAA
jgi:hypothetical protein